MIESFLEQNGIDEPIDINVIEIHKKQTASIIAALFQIFSIIYVFAEKEWFSACKVLKNNDEDNAILDVINKIG